jgi:hypothetical protein
MFRVCLSLPVLGLLLAGCLGYKTPVVSTQEDLQQLDPKTEWIRGRWLSDDAVLSLGRITGAKYLDLCGGYAGGRLNMTDAGFKNLLAVSDSLPNLESIDLCGCPRITDQAIEYIAQMPHIKKLVISGGHSLTDQSLSYLANSKSIEMIALVRCRNISNEGFRFLRNSTALKRITLVGFDSTQFNNTGLSYLATMPNLEFLHLTDTPFLDSESLRIMATMPNLQELSFDIDNPVGPEAAKVLASFPNLKKLTIFGPGCPLVSNESIQFLSKSKTLEEACFSMMGTMTLDGVLSSLSHVKTLRKVTLNRVNKVEKDPLKKFQQALPECAVEITNDDGVYVYRYRPKVNAPK